MNMSIKQFKPMKFKSIKKYEFYEKMYLNKFYKQSKYSYDFRLFMNLYNIKKHALNPIRNNKLRYIKKSKYNNGLIC